MSPVPAVQDLILAARRGRRTTRPDRDRGRPATSGPTTRLLGEGLARPAAHHGRRGRRNGTRPSTRSGDPEPLADAVDRSALTEAVGALEPPPRRGEAALARRRRLAAYGLLSPGGVYLLLFFLVPMLLIVYTSLKSGGLLLGRHHVHVGVPELRRCDSRSTRPSSSARSSYAGIATIDLHLARVPDGLLDRVLRGEVEVHALLHDPDPVLRVVRDPDGHVEIHPRGRRSPVRHAEGLRHRVRELPRLGDARRRDLGSRV